jgi:hypothetical protein
MNDFDAAFLNSGSSSMNANFNFYTRAKDLMSESIIQPLIISGEEK